MNRSIVLSQEPKIEIEILERGINIIDEKEDINSGYYAYEAVKNVNVNKAYYPRLAGVLKGLTWLLNGVPMYPDAETCKQSSMVIKMDEASIGMWLTDQGMVEQALQLKTCIDEKKASKVH